MRSGLLTSMSLQRVEHQSAQQFWCKNTVDFGGIFSKMPCRSPRRVPSSPGGIQLASDRIFAAVASLTSRRRCTYLHCGVALSPCASRRFNTRTCVMLTARPRQSTLCSGASSSMICGVQNGPFARRRLRLVPNQGGFARHRSPAVSHVPAPPVSPRPTTSTSKCGKVSNGFRNCSAFKSGNPLTRRWGGRTGQLLDRSC